MTKISGLDDLDVDDVDLIDKIKAAITKLKSTEQRSNQLKFKTVNFPCSLCDKNCNVNQFIAHNVNFGFTIHAVEHPNKNMQRSLMRRMMLLFNVYFAL